MELKKITFVKSVSDENLLESNLTEIAVVGKSNVGKSSLINMLANNSKLARSSKDPGRTRLINYFNFDDKFLLVDLPGYGFAKVSKEEQKKWGVILENYLASSSNLKHVFVLIDIRHGAGDHDLAMINYLVHYGIPFSIIATKQDKVNKRDIKDLVLVISQDTKVPVGNIIVSSNENKTGRNEILSRIEQVLAQ